jgi:lauroyl/myristoyl acyltransferase
MRSTDKQTNFRSETFHSPALYKNELTAIEAIDGAGDQSSGGSRIKAIIMPRLHWLLRHTPAIIALVPVHLIVLLLRALYWLPRNPWRQSCESICQIADRAGHSHRPAQVYQQMLTNLLSVARNFAVLYDRGDEQALEQIQLSVEDDALIKQLVEEYGGVLLTIPHNFDSVYSMIQLNSRVPLLLVARNPATIERTRVAIDFYERMKVKIMLVRGGNPFELSRNLFSVLKSGHVVTVTVDSLDRSKERVEVDMFGGRVGFNSWAAKIAARRSIPMLPAYLKSGNKRTTFSLGEPLVSKDIDELMQHYTRFFEQSIVEDPASWAFLADKNWIKMLRKINAGID